MHVKTLFAPVIVAKAFHVVAVAEEPAPIVALARTVAPEAVIVVPEQIAARAAVIVPEGLTCAQVAATAPVDSTVAPAVETECDNS